MLLLVPLAQGLNQTANIVKGFAIAIGVAIAIAFVWMWWMHRQRERGLELAVRSQSTWSAWLRLAAANPELAEPGLGAIGEPAEIVRYRSFVAALLSTAEEILLITPTATWQETIARALAPHASHLSSPEFQSAAVKDCSAGLRQIISVVAGAHAQG